MPFHDPSRLLLTLGLALICGLPSCEPEKTEKAVKTASHAEADPVHFQIGSITVLESDLVHYLKEHHAGRTDEAARQESLKELAARAQLVQAALDENLEHDAIVRAQVGRILANRFKEQMLFPKLKNITAPLPEDRLRELYQANESRYRSNEKRQTAVLWLNPGKDKSRIKQYEQKLAKARDWYLENADLQKQPSLGFSVLSVDHSEHQASRFKGGMVGWLESSGGMDSWSKAVAEIVFSLEKPGAVSPVIVRPEGLFLVMYLAQAPALLRPFEEVSHELEITEIARLRQQAEAQFMRSLEKRHPVKTIAPGPANDP